MSVKNSKKGIHSGREQIKVGHITLQSLKDLTDEKLLEALETAKSNQLSADFIQLLESEMKLREGTNTNEVI